MKEEAQAVDQSITIVLRKPQLIGLAALVNELLDDGRMVVGFHKPYTFIRQRLPRLFVR